MQEPISPTKLPSVECDYQPEPGSLAGFLVTLSEKVDELLLAANWHANPE